MLQIVYSRMVSMRAGVHSIVLNSFQRMESFSATLPWHNKLQSCVVMISFVYLILLLQTIFRLGLPQCKAILNLNRLLKVFNQVSKHYCHVTVDHMTLGQ